MIEIDYSLCGRDKVGKFGVAETELDSLKGDCGKAIAKLREWQKSGDASFLSLPSDDEISELQRSAKEWSGKAKDIVVLGIGGSALGLKCLNRALMKPLYEFESGKRLFVLDNVDPEQFESVMDAVDWDNSLFVVISKSGRTLETATQLFMVRQKLEEKFGNGWKDHIVAVTDSKKGILRELVDSENLRSMSIPAMLGGRYSVLSPVGLLPAAMMGMNVAKLVKGAASYVKKCLEDDALENPALRWAAYNILMQKRGFNISVIMPYSYRLELLADWYLQLWGESLGKGGNGSTPVKALGTTDQHSQLQLYMQGPRDKFITFIAPMQYEKGAAVKDSHEDFSYVKGKGMGDVIEAELRATGKALAESGCPSVTLRIDMKKPEFSLGETFMLLESATALTGAMMDVNPFDQPGVERGKVLAREILEKF